MVPRSHPWHWGPRTCCRLGAFLETVAALSQGRNNVIPRSFCWVRGDGSGLCPPETVPQNPTGRTYHESKLRQLDLLYNVAPHAMSTRPIFEPDVCMSYPPVPCLSGSACDVI